MHRLGLVLHVSPHRNIIIKVESTPRIGEIVVDENLKSIGKVVDLLGPVSSPYATIQPTIRDAEKLVKKIMYIFPSKRRKEKNVYG